MIIELLEDVFVGHVGLDDRHLGPLPSPARRPGGARLLLGIVPSAATVLGSEVPCVLDAAEAPGVDHSLFVAVRSVIRQFGHVTFNYNWP